MHTVTATHQLPCRFVEFGDHCVRPALAWPHDDHHLRLRCRQPVRFEPRLQVTDLPAGLVGGDPLNGIPYRVWVQSSIAPVRVRCEGHLIVDFGVPAPFGRRCRPSADTDRSSNTQPHRRRALGASRFSRVLDPRRGAGIRPDHPGRRVDLSSECRSRRRAASGPLVTDRARRRADRRRCRGRSSTAAAYCLIWRLRPPRRVSSRSCMRVHRATRGRIRPSAAATPPGKATARTGRRTLRTPTITAAPPPAPHKIDRQTALSNHKLQLPSSSTSWSWWPKSTPVADPFWTGTVASAP